MGDRLDGFVGVIATAVVALLLVGGVAAFQLGTQFDRTITVEQHADTAGRVSDGNGGGHTMLVKTSDGDWYKCSDALFHWQFNSRDVWGDMRDGKTYRVHGFGWRIGLLSAYPTITRAQETTGGTYR